MNNGEKKPLPKFDDKWLYCYLHVALKIIEKLSGQDASICIKPEALESMPDFEKPMFVWDNSKGHWMALNPKELKPEKTKIATPSKGIVRPGGLILPP